MAKVIAVPVCSFNMLGHSHTAPGGNKVGRGWADGPTRAGFAASFISRRKLSIIGTQENQAPQQKVLKEKLPSYASHGFNDNSIWWDDRVWDRVTAGGLDIPYFDGKDKRMPYVLLEHTQTHQLLWVYNAHNPADTRGPAQRHRREGWKREAALYTQLRKTQRAPILSVGDKNARTDYLAHMPSRLHPATTKTIDFICGTPRIRFSDVELVRTPLVRKTTDHRVTIATMRLKVKL